MIAGLVAVEGELDATLRSWLEQTWADEGRVASAVSDGADHLMLSATPSSPLWTSSVLDRSGYHGVLAARLPGMDVEQFWNVAEQIPSSTNPPVLGNQLNGAYAAALLNSRGLILIRDQFGQVPLYWRRIGGHVFFSSVLRDFTSIPGHPHAVNQGGLALMMTGGLSELGDRSSLVSVHRAVPGAVTQIGPAEHVTAPLWQMDCVEVQESLSFAGAVNLMDEALSRAVADAVDPAETVASHFSGGLDSTLIAYLAQEHLGRSGGSLARLYSWTPESDSPPPDGESRVIRQLAAGIGVPLWFGSSTRDDSLVARDPSVDPTQVLGREVHCLRDAQVVGISVILSGWGGDEFASFSGRHYVENLFRRGKYRSAFAQQIAQSRRGFASPWYGRVRGTGAAVKRWRASRGAGSLPNITSSGPDEFQASSRAADRHWKSASSREIMATLMASGHLPYRVEQWWEEGRQQGVEYRYPMLDMNVVSAALAIPEALWAYSGRPRAVIRQVAAQRVEPAWAMSIGKKEPELSAFRQSNPPRITWSPAVVAEEREN